MYQYMRSLLYNITTIWMFLLIRQSGLTQVILFRTDRTRLTSDDLGLLSQYFVT